MEDRKQVWKCRGEKDVEVWTEKWKKHSGRGSNLGGSCCTGFREEETSVQEMTANGVEKREKEKSDMAGKQQAIKISKKGCDG